MCNGGHVFLFFILDRPLGPVQSPSNRCDLTRPLLSGWLILYWRGWEGVRGHKTVRVPKIDLQLQAPLINFIFVPGKNFLMWVGAEGGMNPPRVTKQTSGLDQ